MKHLDLSSAKQLPCHLAVDFRLSSAACLTEPCSGQKMRRTTILSGRFLPAT
jgi:hypothetical protein